MVEARRLWLARIGYKDFCSAALTLTSHHHGPERPDLPTEKLVSFVDYVGKAVSSKRILEWDIIAMDKITTGHEKSHLTVVLAAKADGTKLRPYIVFKGAVHEVKAMQQQISSAVIAMYHCHQKCGYNITTAVIPGGCTKYIQAPDVMWNQPFKQSLHDIPMIDGWLGTQIRNTQPGIT